jgi:hypothetical protein
MSSSKMTISSALTVLSVTAVFLFLSAKDARAETIDFTGVVACTDIAPCGGSTFTVTGTYDYDAGTETLGAYSFVTPFGSIASTSVSAIGPATQCRYINGQRVCRAKPATSGGSALVFFGDDSVGGAIEPASLALVFDESNTSGVGSILTSPVLGEGSDVCVLNDCPVSEGSITLNFTSGTSREAVPTPEPSSLALLGVGMLALAGLTLKKSS